MYRSLGDAYIHKHISTHINEYIHVYIYMYVITNIVCGVSDTIAIAIHGKAEP